MCNKETGDFFPSVQNAAAETWLTRLGKMGNNDMDDLEGKE